jgi:phosphohistidine phosphatase
MRDDCAVRRQLLLVRHAKSSWDDTSLADRDRPLAPRGIKALAGMRDHLQRSGHRPEIVLCSPSRRTIDTLDSIRAAIPEHARVVLADELYGATANSLLALLRGVDDGIDCAMVVGHNPTVQDLALLLVGEGDADIRGQLATKLPTGAVVTMSFDGDWADLHDGVAALDDLYMPRPPRS